MSETKDIVERLSGIGCDREPFTPEHAKCQCQTTATAASLIEDMTEVLQDFVHFHTGHIVPPELIGIVDRALVALAKPKGE